MELPAIIHAQCRYGETLHLQIQLFFLNGLFKLIELRIFLFLPFYKSAQQAVVKNCAIKRFTLSQLVAFRIIKRQHQKKEGLLCQRQNFGRLIVILFRQ